MLWLRWMPETTPPLMMFGEESPFNLVKHVTLSPTTNQPLSSPRKDFSFPLPVWEWAVIAEEDEQNHHYHHWRYRLLAPSASSANDVMFLTLTTGSSNLTPHHLCSCISGCHQQEASPCSCEREEINYNDDDDAHHCCATKTGEGCCWAMSVLLPPGQYNVPRHNDQMDDKWERAVSFLCHSFPGTNHNSSF